VSIRLRLTLWYVLLLCVGLAAFAAAVLWQTQQSADSTLDTALRRRAEEISGDLHVDGRGIVRVERADEHSGDAGQPDLWVRVLDARGAVLAVTGPSLAGLAPTDQRAAAPGGQQWRLPGDRHARAFVLPVVWSGRRLATVQTAAATTSLEEARHQLLAAMAVAGALIAAVAAFGGLFLADRALRPVDRITRLAAGIGAGDLHRRVAAEARRGPGSGVPGDELGRLASTFDAMLARLEQADERRRRLTADVAHELCTPIATLISGAEVTLRHPRSSSDYQAALARVLDESRHMGLVVDDLLLLARVDAGALPLHRELVEFDDVCRQAIAALGVLASEHGVTLRTDLPPHVVLALGDETRLAQVVRNLLDNALRYTPPGGVVTLSLEEPPVDAPGQSVQVELHVRDTGPGIPPAERGLIFERFHRAPTSVASPSARRLGGSGLGLAICLAIVEAHGGTITLRETPPVAPGAHFVVALPAVRVADSPAPEDAAPASADRRGALASGG